jgi:alkyl hydroperoxide reductase subunit AhpC
MEIRMALVAIHCPPTDTLHTARAATQVIGFAALRGWLHGNWGVVFSHPEDFASYGFEADRWLVHVQDAFTDTGVRPIALAASGEPNMHTWVTEAGGVQLVLRRQLNLQGVDALPARSLERALSGRGRTGRFVAIVDETLQVQRTIVYERGDRMPSPMELARMAVKLRSGAQEGAGPNVTAAKGTVTSLPLRRS